MGAGSFPEPRAACWCPRERLGLLAPRSAQAEAEGALLSFPRHFLLETGQVSKRPRSLRLFPHDRGIRKEAACLHVLRLVGFLSSFSLLSQFFFSIFFLSVLPLFLFSFSSLYSSPSMNCTSLLWPPASRLCSVLTHCPHCAHSTTATGSPEQTLAASPSCTCRETPPRSACRQPFLISDAGPSGAWRRKLGLSAAPSWCTPGDCLPAG